MVVVAVVVVAAIIKNVIGYFHYPHSTSVSTSKVFERVDGIGRGWERGGCCAEG